MSAAEDMPANDNLSQPPPAAMPESPTEHRGGADIERIMDLPITLHVELGSIHMNVRDLLEVGVGAVLELDAAAGAPLSIYANRTLVARGEAVVIGERYGVRVTEIVSEQERVRRLGK